VELRQLEQKAQSYQKLYQTFLQRYHEAAQQESFPLADAHIISAAMPPLAASQPRTALVLAIAAILGIVAGGAAAVLRELTDYVFRTADQVRGELGIDAIGLLPLVPAAQQPRESRIATNVPISRYAIDNPLSAFAETLRLVKIAVDLALRDRSPKVIGVVSLLPKEGKSTVAMNFASALASQGKRTLLIDADTRNPTLTRVMEWQTEVDAQLASATLPPLAEFLRYEPDSGLHVMPCIFANNNARLADGLSSEVLEVFLQSHRHSFDYIVIDLPPIGPVAAAGTLASTIDAFLLIVEWGVTSRGAVRAALAKERQIREKLVGVILNKVDLTKLHAYEHFGTVGYYRKQYEAYYNRKT